MCGKWGVLLKMVLVRSVVCKRVLRTPADGEKRAGRGAGNQVAMEVKYTSSKKEEICYTTLCLPTKLSFQFLHNKALMIAPHALQNSMHFWYVCHHIPILVGFSSSFVPHYENTTTIIIINIISNTSKKPPQH